jgi:hypothetical protein
LRQACGKIGRETIPTRMSFRVNFTAITGNTTPAGADRPTGQGTPAQVRSDEAAALLGDVYRRLDVPHTIRNLAAHPVANHSLPATVA